ncbi:MAG: phytanoyl-CoA dioxygenase family protein [Candidatus Poribacteria bacterium]|nr:phytanoyl-CoA dioxygenase family protein [Candidatus Poribacteria bacterium]
MALEVQRAGADVKPTLTDQDVLDFCRTGFLLLEGVIPDSTNRWVFEHLDREDAQPNQLVTDARFVEEVLLHPEVAGAVRSLLGQNFQLPDWMANHRLVGPVPAARWHVDGGSGFERLCNLLQVFYLPQENTKEVGPTLFLPGSHIVPIAREELDHFGHLAGQVATVAPAGSVFVTAYSIWHRQSEKRDQSVRNMLKWEFWRTVPPRRDWVVDPDFDFASADYSYTNDYFCGATRKWQSVPRVAEMFYWLCGKSDDFHMVGGSGWPFSASDPGIRAKSP